MTGKHRGPSDLTGGVSDQPPVSADWMVACLTAEAERRRLTDLLRVREARIATLEARRARAIAKFHEVGDRKTVASRMLGALDGWLD